MIFAVSYGVSAIAFLTLIVLMVINKRPQNIGLGVLAACCLTLVWSIAAAVQPWWRPGVAHLFESVSTAAWLAVLAATLTRTPAHADRILRPATFIGALILGCGSVLNDLRFLSVPVSSVFSASQILARIVVGIGGILLVENVFRNTPPQRRWHLFPFCIAIGGLFAYQVFVFCAAVVLKAPDPTLLAARGLVLTLFVPLLVLTMARNPDWKIDVHVSRNVVFHGATLVAAGIFLLASGGVASLLGRIHGEWAGVTRIAFFFASVIFLLTVVSAAGLRSRVKRFIADNFYSAQYDYRVEWLRSVATLSETESGEPLFSRCIRTVADIVDSPAGALWVEDDAAGYSLVYQQNMKVSFGSSEPRNSLFISGFQAGTVVQAFDRNGGSITGAPAWAQENIWIAVPLVRVGHLLGFVTLAPPRASAVLNRESCDLLLAVGQQVASFLAEARATRSLAESRALIEHSKRLSFVAHDVKNVLGQLALMIRNIRQFGHQEAFRSDLIRGIEASVKRLQEILERLRPGAQEVQNSEVFDPAAVIDHVVATIGLSGSNVQSLVLTKRTRVRMPRAALESVLTHLVRNGIEACSSRQPVSVELKEESGRAIIDVIDNGCGMTEEFIRNDLFTPLRSTKTGGHGIGAFQARDLVRMAGGDMQVHSRLGGGTTIRISLPDVRDTLEDCSLLKAASV